MAEASETPLARLTSSLVRRGYQPNDARCMAAGIVSALREWCWANQTDILGESADVDRIGSSPLAGRSLARLLVSAGILGIEKGRLFCPSAYTERPVYVDKRWRRDNPKSYAEAQRRASDTAVSVPEPELEVYTPEAGQTDLFGQPLEPTNGDGKKRKPQTNGTPGFQELRAYWCERWSAAHRGAQYPWAYGLDGKCLKRLIEQTIDIDQAKGVIDAYLACRERWYSGHPFKKLIGDLPRFVSAGDHRPDEIEYGGTGTVPDL